MSKSLNNDFKIFQVAILNYINTVVPTLFSSPIAREGARAASSNGSLKGEQIYISPPPPKYAWMFEPSNVDICTLKYEH